jgi:glycosyltransferase involved in cell wall biosynthesis
VVCLNEEERRFLTDHHWSAASQIEVQPNAVSSELIAPRSYRARGTHLIFLGQWLPRKGVTSLVAAFDNLSRKNSGLHLVCAGTQKAEEQVLADFAPEARNRVTVLPRFTRSSLSTLLSESDIFVFPSHFEGASLALLEAMASGLPIVTTSVGAAPDLLHHEESAVFVPAGDAKSLETAIQELVNDPQRRGRLGQAAQLVAHGLTRDQVDPKRVRFLEKLWLSDEAALTL